MGRIRNPRYAPEFLESRLSPSAFLPAYCNDAEVSTQMEFSETEEATETPLPVDENGDPIPEPIEFDPNGLPCPT
ncbi:hypothetical protein BH23PLA1_BH23PLA1_33570 [soil metagenome]